jgi:hypothetical protein
MKETRGRHELGGISTSSGRGQLGHAKTGIVAGDGLKGNVRVPLALLALLLAKELVVDLLGLNGGDDTDLVVDVLASAGVHDRVNMQFRSRGLARELAEALDELLLQLVGQVVLLAEEDDATFRDYVRISGFSFYFLKGKGRESYQ